MKRYKYCVCDEHTLLPTLIRLNCCPPQFQVARVPLRRKRPKTMLPSRRKLEYKVTHIKTGMPEPPESGATSGQDKGKSRKRKDKVIVKGASIIHITD